jgi:hypothetical protein
VASARPDVAGTHKVRVRAIVSTTSLNQTNAEVGQLSLTVMR